LIIFIEYLSISSIFCLLLNKTVKSKKILNIYYFDSSNFIEWTLRRFATMFKLNIERINFSFEELKDENGTNIIYKIAQKDYQFLWSKLENLFNNTNNQKINNEKYFINYIKKTLLSHTWPGEASENPIRNLLIMLHVAVMRAKKYTKNKNIIFFINNREFFDILNEYGNKSGVQLIGVKRPIISLKIKSILYFKNNLLVLFIYNIFHSLLMFKQTKLYNNSLFSDSNNIIIDQVMQFFNASFFWSLMNKIANQIIFVSKTHKIERDQLDDINVSGMHFVSLSKAVSNGLDISLYLENKHNWNKNISFYQDSSISKLANDFVKEKRFWKSFFKDTNSTMYGTHDKWSSKVIPAFAAVNEIGGVSFLWQTSYYEFPTPTASVFSDIYFCFSPSLISTEIKSGSNIKYLVSVGYIFDNHYKVLKPKAIALRNKLHKKGVRKIISFFDGGSYWDERWGFSNHSLQEDYKFWLEKLLTTNWLGLIIKSKKPGSLPRRLENISDLLNKALLTGRCHLIGEANYIDKDLKSRPAIAAMASDIAIHERLDAGSAGVEAALSGVATLMYDRYGLKRSQFYQNGSNEIVFNDWSTMWKSIVKNWNTSPGKNLGGWNKIINNIDPFRDGKAGDRMTSYVQFIHEGLNSGMSSQKIMESASINYSEKWGEDKVIKICT